MGCCQNLIAGNDRAGVGRHRHRRAVCFGPVRKLVGPLGEDRLASLTVREREVLVHMAQGGGNEAIAEQLGIEVLTVKKHRQNLMRKLGVNSAVEASRKAYQLGLLILTQHE